MIIKNEFFVAPSKLAGISLTLFGTILTQPPPLEFFLKEF